MGFLALQSKQILFSGLARSFLNSVSLSKRSAMVTTLRGSWEG